MKIFNCILGVFSILGAVYCMFFPGVTFLNAGWLVTILLGVYGLCSIFTYFSNPARKEKKNNTGLVANGVIGLIMGIGAAVVSILAMFNTGIHLSLDIIMLLMFAFWLVYSGIASVAAAIKQKKLGGKMWGLTLALGIAVILTGIYSVSHLLFAAMSIGYMIGIELMIYGVRLVMSVFENNESR